MFAAQDGATPNDKLYVDDVFSAYTYTGNNSTQTINNGIDLAGKGGMVWIKARNTTFKNTIYDTARIDGKFLVTDTTAAASDESGGSSEFNSANSSGFTIVKNNFSGTSNNNTQPYISWTFRKAAKFFGVSTVTKYSGSNATVSFSSLSTLGMVAVKSTDSTGSWHVWHRSLTAGKLLYLEQTAAEATLGHITVSGTTVTLANGTIADGSYAVYAWAHDTGTDNLIQCGSFTTDGSGNATVNHGWSAGVQFALIKCSSTTGDWEMFDTARTSGWSGSDARLRANIGNAEDSVTRLSASGTTVSFAGLSNSATYIYMLIVSPT